MIRIFILHFPSNMIQVATGPVSEHQHEVSDCSGRLHKEDEDEEVFHEERSLNNDKVDDHESSGEDDEFDCQGEIEGECNASSEEIETSMEKYDPEDLDEESSEEEIE